MYIESTNKQGTFRGDEQGHKLLKLIDDMGWDYDRFSSSGQETYDKIQIPKFVNERRFCRMVKYCKKECRNEGN